MTGTFLEKILASTRARVQKLKDSPEAHSIGERALRYRATATSHAFRAAFADRQPLNIIAEIKRASPSKGDINTRRGAAATAVAYRSGGASAISVLTEPEFFKGSLEDLKAVRRVTSLPILRKDFIVDEIQIVEAAAAGADAVLLIVAALSAEELRKFHRQAAEFTMDALVEVHDAAELQTALELGFELIGVNNRSLHSFNVTLETSRELIRSKPESAIMISESGIRTRVEMDELKGLGFDGFLIGETLMRQDDPEVELKKWLQAAPLPVR